jgi:hypothetical protein
MMLILPPVHLPMFAAASLQLGLEWKLMIPIVRILVLLLLLMLLLLLLLISIITKSVCILLQQRPMMLLVLLSNQLLPHTRVMVFVLIRREMVMMAHRCHQQQEWHRRWCRLKRQQMKRML